MLFSGDATERAVMTCDPMADGSHQNVCTECCRISIIGPTGSGKSHLAHELARYSCLPLYELDQLRVDQFGIPRGDQDFVEDVKSLAATNCWIIDGHYRIARGYIWDRAQVVIYLDHPFPHLMTRLLRRWKNKKMALRALERDQLPGLPSGNQRAVKVKATQRQRFKRMIKTWKEQDELRDMMGLLRSKNVHVIVLQSFKGAVQLYQKVQLQGVAALLETETQPRDSWFAADETTPVVELFGLPGSGKTTVTDAVIDRLALETRTTMANAWRNAGLQARMRLFARTACDFPLLFSAARMAVHCRLYSRESIHRLVRMLFMKHWLRDRPGPVVLDQWGLQNVWSIFMASGKVRADPEDIAMFLRRFYEDINVTVVVVEVDDALSSARIASRTDGSSRFDAMSGATLEAHVSRSHSLIDAIVSAVKICGFKVRFFDGAAPVARLATDLEHVIRHDCMPGRT